MDNLHEQKAIAVAWAMTNGAINNLQTGFIWSTGYSAYKDGIIERLEAVKRMLDEMATELGQ